MPDPAILVRDLFGDIVTLPSGRRGRPAHVWTKENADKVILGLALKYSDAQIASGLHISVPTLKKHYFSELKARDMQRARFEMWRVHRLATLADEGNVTAMKELDRAVQRRDRQLAEERVRNAQSDDQSKPKKIARQEAAEEIAAGNSADWGDDLAVGGRRPN